MDGLILTEHHNRWPDSKITEMRDHCIDSGYCRENFLIIPGQEIEARDPENKLNYGHVLVIGADKSLIEMNVNDLCGLAEKEGWALVAAHPGQVSGLSRFWEYPIHGFELLHRNQDNHYVRRLAEDHCSNLAKLGSDDIHHLGHEGHYCTLFPKGTKTEQDIIQAIKDRMTEPYKFKR